MGHRATVGGSLSDPTDGPEQRESVPARLLFFRTRTRNGIFNRFFTIIEVLVTQFTILRGYALQYRTWVAAILLICAGLTLPFFFRAAPRPIQAKLRDGTIVRFEKAGIDSISYDAPSSFMTQRVNRVPFGVQSPSRERIQATFPVQPQELGLLFSVHTKEGKPNTDPVNSIPSRSGYLLSRVDFVESTGFIFQSPVTGQTTVANLVSLSQGPFPHRDPILEIRCYEPENQQRFLDIKIPNPGFQAAYDEWSPESLPASRTVEPLTVTLNHGLDEFKRPTLSDEDLTVTSTDPRWNVAELERNWWLTDVTGNRSPSLLDLSPFEPAWKLNIQFRRKASAQFSDEEIWRTKLFSLPAESSAQRISAHQRIEGIDCRVTVIASAGKVTDDGVDLPFENEIFAGTAGKISHTNRAGQAFVTLQSPKPFIHVIHSRLDEETELLFTVRDQTGQVISTESSHSTEILGESMRIVQFAPTDVTTDVLLEVTVNRGRTCEFLVQPGPWRRPD